jgi:hypothetical protein
MTCNRGKASPDTHTTFQLFADSGGYCQKPGCTRPLFLELPANRIHIAEIAHIIAAADRGPRANSALTQEQRGHYDNLLLLCPTCHTIVDKAPDTYPDALVSQWKRDHKERLAQVFGVTRCNSRFALRKTIAPILAANKTIFDAYGPSLDHTYNPESDGPGIWRRKVLTSIIPNNRRLAAILDANRELLGARELALLEDFRQHVDDLTARHLDADRLGGGKTFPNGMDLIGQDEASDG